MNRDHPVIVALRETTKIRPADLDFLIEKGRPYRGVRLPSGVLRWPLGDCVPGAEEFEDRGLGRFTYGFCLRPDKRRPFPHAWVSRDGFRAVDPTLPDSDDCQYWGMPDRQHHDRINDMLPSTYRGSKSFGIPLDVIGGGVGVPGLRPFVFRM